MTNKTFTIWRIILIAGSVIGLAGIVGEMVWSGDNGKLQGAEVIALATSTKITVDGAVETALGTMAGQVIEAKLEKRGDKTAWNIDILTTEEAIMTVCIDAVSGAMLLTEEKVPGKKPVQGKAL
jgi:Peptidase propeptide and YPEB domain